MRPLTELERYRDPAWEIAMAGILGDDYAGCFRLRSPFKAPKGAKLWTPALNCIVSAYRPNEPHPSNPGWDHVSVSNPTRTPTWEEMDWVKRQFFLPHEIAMQLHVAESEHLSVHHHCLHIWRPVDQAIPLPPSWMVA